MCHRLVIGADPAKIDDTSDNNNNRNYQALKTADKCSGHVENMNNGNINNRPDKFMSLKTAREETRRKLNSENQRSDSPITCTIKTSLKKVIRYSCFKLGRCYW